MSMNVGPAGDDDEEQIINAINTTPLVDVMLVLLIIFLITIPVVTHTIPLTLPKQENIPRETKPENIEISVDKGGDIYWNQRIVPDTTTLFNKLAEVAVKVPQPEVHIRGDGDARYQSIGKVVQSCQRASILKISFVIEPPPRG